MNDKEKNVELLILTGMSGAGRTQAVRLFEDLGFFCADNFPPVLIDHFINLAKETKGKISKIVFGIDVRSGEFFPELMAAVEESKKKGVPARILFLDASNDVLIQRFNESRRKHPLHENVLEGIAMERKLLSKIRGQADKLIDTSQLTVKQLRSMLMDLFVETKKIKDEITLSLSSFGFRYGTPADADIIFDGRFISSPSSIDVYQKKNGFDPMVKEYILLSPLAKAFLKKMKDLIETVTPGYIKEGKRYFTIAIGSELGRHRAPVLVRELAHMMEGEKCKVVEWHRDLEK